MERFIIYITFDNSIVEYVLPGINNRSGHLDLSGETGIKNLVISYEVWDGIWYFRANDLVRLSHDHIVISESRQIQDDETYNGKIYRTGERFVIMVKAFKKEMSRFHKFEIRGMDTIIIGNSRDANINISDRFVSGYHAAISRQNGQWYLFDQSRNGTYVNYKKVNKSVSLSMFDHIYIFGYKIIFLGDILAVNQMGVISTDLRPAFQADLCDNQMYEDQTAFSRMPRFMEPFDEEKIEIEGPPTRRKEKKVPLLYTLGPSLTMPIPILATVLFNIFVSSRGGGSSNPIMYFGMVISVFMFSGLGVMWTVLKMRYDKRVAAEEETIRQAAYMDYIAQNEELLLAKQNYNRGVLEKKYLSSRTLMQCVTASPQTLWDRNVNHDDFLTIRIGKGMILSPNPVMVPKARFSVENDVLAEEPMRLFKSYEYIDGAVKLLNFKKHKIIGVIGEHDKVNGLAENMIVQLTALHSYTDLHLAFITNGEYDFEWAKWFPHVFSRDWKCRYIGCDKSSVENTIEELTREIRGRIENMESEEKTGFSSRYVVFCTDKQLIENETLYKYMVSEVDYGFTFVLLYETINRLPNECKLIVEASSNYQGLYLLEESYDYTKSVQFEMLSHQDVAAYARGISRFTIHEISQGSIPDAVNYLDLLGIGCVEQWDLLKNYKEHRAYEGIRSLVGIAAGNKPMYLDIHEKKHGPHGLVAGTTGSGKSETIQTFILSLALNYHPDEVSFILIDYKGGGMANVFLKLPHLAGTITNLGAGDEASESIDESQTRRALISIRSEIKRRQKIFNQYRINHIDAYIRMYRDQQVEEPLPHLIIISDEFAELKKEQPEFIRELVSAARVGRSLGMHLILATQKPAGVVDDEIWSNSRFKLCLRVQDKQDSMGMLKRPEAAYITQTGRAYLQIGNDEIFEMFQSGYSGADYEPKNTVSAGNEEVSMIGIDGRKLVSGKAKSKGKAVATNPISQLDACVNYIADTARKAGIRNAKPLWLPPLKRAVYLQDLLEEYGLPDSENITALIGQVDNPERQAMQPYYLDLNQINNLLIVGNSGCGKTTLLQTMLVSLLFRYAASQVQFYILDFSSRTMKLFRDMPHVGDVFYSDEQDGVKRTFDYLLRLTETRKALFQKEGVGSFTEYRKMAGDVLPTVILIIDNFFDFLESYPEHEESYAKLCRDGSKYGIQVVTTVNRVADIRYKLRQNFTKMIALQLTEKGDYMDVIGKNPAVLPTAVQGRGLVMFDEILEFQTALPEYGAGELERSNTIRERIQAYVKEYGGVYAEKIPVLPDDKLYREIVEDMQRRNAGAGKLLVGFDMDNMKESFIDPAGTYCYAVSATTEEGIANLFCNLSYAAGIYGYVQHLVCLDSSFPGKRKMQADDTYTDQDGIYELLIHLKGEFSRRSARRKELKSSQETGVTEQILTEFPKEIIFIDDMDRFVHAIYDAGYKETMNPIVELFFREGKELGIVFVAGMPDSMEAATVYSAACKEYMRAKTGIHLGGVVKNQRLFEFNLPLSEHVKPLPMNIGYVAEKSKTHKIFVPLYEEERHD